MLSYMPVALVVPWFKNLNITWLTYRNKVQVLETGWGTVETLALPLAQ